MVEDRKLLQKDKVLKGKLPLTPQKRSERSCYDLQSFDHGPETTPSRQKMAIESGRTNIQVGQPGGGTRR